MNKYLVLIITFISIFIFTQLCIRYSTEISREYNLDTPLPDLYHQALPDYRLYHEYTDFMPVIPLILFIYLDKFNHIYEYLLLISIIYILRAICFTVTVLPSPSKECECEWEIEPKTKLRKFLNIIYQEGCNDCIFSGHTSTMIMSTLFLLRYNINNTFVKVILIIYNILGALAIIVTRLHYTVDVFLATIINILLFFAFGHNSV